MSQIVSKRISHVQVFISVNIYNAVTLMSEGALGVGWSVSLIIVAAIIVDDQPGGSCVEDRVESSNRGDCSGSWSPWGFDKWHSGVVTGPDYVGLLCDIVIRRKINQTSASVSTVLSAVHYISLVIYSR